MELPKIKNSYNYENNFYLSCDTQRIGKFLAHYELFKMSAKIPGSIIECGVFKGNSLIRFASFRELGISKSKKIIGFDMFGKFPETNFQKDKKIRKEFINTHGSEGITKQQLIKVLKQKKIDQKIELIKGNIIQTIPNYVKKYPKLKISFLNLDSDTYEAAKIILEYLYPKITKGGVLLLDDYGVWPGETKAVDEYFKNKKVKIKKSSFSNTPLYIIKE
tara:strand:+ start:102 stop:758 length:657 start_codon:yes stop_codon:yes gene_type:complete